ncbi:aerolysin-like protein [Mercenaria mercenaria]|uniref:aerolysin-like protein n=1 Tax=Mercenaria mercenaria TaxID=6596 RepID=UPI00234E4BB8|nr:aerolysin-like protein [Mercenaria mercenaria]
MRKVVHFIQTSHPPQHQKAEMPFIFKDPSVNTDYFTDDHASGGEGGQAFNHIKINEGAILTKIKAWKRDWRIGAIQVWMSDGSNYLAGKPGGGESSEFKFKKGETIVSLNVQASGPYSSILSRRRLGAIWFKTSKDRSWGIFSRNLTADGRYWPEVGSGVCCGVFGGSGDAIDRFGFAMLRPVESSMLSEIKYPQLNIEIVATRPTTVAHQIFCNGSKTEQTFTLSGSRSVTIKREWSLSTQLSMTFKMEVTAGIPEVASVTSGFSWTVGSTSTHAVSNTETETQSWSWPLKCPPHTKILGEATMYADDIDTPYEGVVELRLKNGKSFKYKVKGVYRGMNARSGTVTVKSLGPCASEESLTEEMYQTSLW